MIAGGFKALDLYLDHKFQERADKKAFEALGKYQDYLYQQYELGNQSQGGVFPISPILDNPNAGKGVLPLDLNMGFNDTGWQNNSSFQFRQPIIDYRSGKMYWPIPGPGGFYQDENGNLFQP